MSHGSVSRTPILLTIICLIPPSIRSEDRKEFQLSLLWVKLSFDLVSPRKFLRVKLVYVPSMIHCSWFEPEEQGRFT